MSFTAIILAAGKGTRMKSALPKPLHAVGGRPMLAWSIDAAKAAGAQKIVTVVGPDSDAIQSWLDGAPFAIQHNQLGTGDAVAAARDALGKDNGAAQLARVRARRAETEDVSESTGTDQPTSEASRYLDHLTVICVGAFASNGGPL